MERQVLNKKVIVTGGVEGIGHSIAEKFLEHGAKVVVILDIQEDKGNAAVAEFNKKYGEGRAVFYKCDVTKDLENVSSEIIRAYATIDVLVNNAGWVKEDSVGDTFDLNVIAPVEWSMKFFENMRVDKGGRGGTILNMSSIYGFKPNKFSPFYAASKHAILGFTKSKGHADTYAKTGVRMIALCPGYTRTKLIQSSIDQIKDDALAEHFRTALWQLPDAVGEGTMEVFKVADSGTAWLIEGGNPIAQV